MSLQLQHRLRQQQLLSLQNLDDFIITIDTTLGDGLNQMRLPVQGSNMVIDWGDGIVETHTQTASPSSSNWITHTYSSAGTYDIKIGNTIETIRFNNEGDKEKPIEVKQWGTAKWISMFSSFISCTNLNITATDIPNFSLLNNIGRIFTLCSNLTYNNTINNWDVSSVTNMDNLMRDTPMNQPLNNWDVSNVTKLNRAFRNCTNFNQPLDDWNVSNADDMAEMFLNTPFNQDISSWDVSKVTKMNSMFFNTPFNQDISSWNIINLTSATNFLIGGTLSTPNYDATLIGWEQTLQNAYPGGVGYPNSGLDIHFGNSQYTLGSAAETARTSLINNFGWNITDSGGI